MDKGIYTFVIPAGNAGIQGQGCMLPTPPWYWIPADPWRDDGVVRIYDFFNGLLSGLDPKDGVL